MILASPLGLTSYISHSVWLTQSDSWCMYSIFKTRPIFPTAVVIIDASQEQIHIVCVYDCSFATYVVIVVVCNKC